MLFSYLEAVMNSWNVFFAD